MSSPGSLDIIIIGAGIGGLAAAIFLSKANHNVTVFESNASLSEIGAGIQISPNAMRILDYYGLKDVFDAEGTENEGAELRRWDSGKVLGKHGAVMAKDIHGYSTITLHRADYQRVLYDATINAGVKVEFGKKVVGYDFYIPSLILEDGMRVSSDLIIAADGIGSHTRLHLFPDSHAEPTPNSAHRVILESSLLAESPVLAPLVTKPSSTIWFGPERHIVAYTIRGTSLYNLVFAGPDSDNTKIGVWNEPASLKLLQKDHEGWEDTVQEILNKAEKVHKWRIGQVGDLPSWRSEKGTTVLMGDAAHAMMPYTAQGANSSIEDAAVLAVCLTRAKSAKDIPTLTKAYEDIRKGRAEKIKHTSRGNMRQYHLEDGPEQEERDRIYAEGLKELSGEEQAKKKEELKKPEKNENAEYGTPGFAMWLFGYDVEEEVDKYFGDANEE